MTVSAARRMEEAGLDCAGAFFVNDVVSLKGISESGWRFGTFFIFPYIVNNHPN